MDKQQIVNELEDIIDFVDMSQGEWQSVSYLFLPENMQALREISDKLNKLTDKLEDEIISEPTPIKPD